MIKHISFDFWDTLYKVNPDFRKNRANYLQKNYGYSPEVIQSAVDATKKICDGTSERTMCTIDAVTQAWHLLNHLNCATVENAIALAKFTEIDFLENPPYQLYYPDQLVQLRNRGLTLSISCNTGLISGESIRTMLQKSGASDLFDFMLFSDEIGHFKPSPFFIQKVLDTCDAKSFEEILHVGDNPVTDGLMCEHTGTNFLLVDKKVFDFDKILNCL